MNKGSQIAKSAPPAEHASGKGPNLTLIYSLFGVALLLAAGIAVLIVLPFYRLRH